MRCAFYEKEITAPLGTDIPGYFESRFAQGIEDRLYAKAVVFAGDDDDTAQMVAIVVVDACELKPEFCKAVAARAATYTGISEEHIAICANHTHYGIPNGMLFCIKDTNFMEVVERLTADCITLAWQNLQPCILNYGMGHEATVAFNRDYVLKDGSVVSNPVGREAEIVRPFAGIDPDLPVLSVKDMQGNLKGALFTYAMHQDTVGGRKFSGDFSSEISIQLKANYGAEFVSMYLAGCCGDINHVDYIGGIQKRITRKIGRILAAEIERVIEQDSRLVLGNDILVKRKEVLLNCRRLTDEQIEYAKRAVADPEKYLTGHEALPHLKLQLRYLAEHEDTDYTMRQPVQVMRIGEVWFFALPGELYHQFGEQIKKGCPGDMWLISELSNGNLGYVPIDELLGTKVYPAILLDTSCVEAGGGDELIRTALALAEEMK